MTTVKLAVCILARDEAAGIGEMIEALGSQSIFSAPAMASTVFLVANGCSDNTAAVAATVAGSTLAPRNIDYHVLDFAEAGKSRAWNRLIHDEMDQDFDLICFLDADIVFIGKDVLADGVAALGSHPDAQAYTGFPLKNIAAKPSPNALDRLSLATSQLTQYVGKLNGQFYIGRGEALRAIWLPDETPGEDGFLNAMIDTKGFTRKGSSVAVIQPASPTHYFEAHSPMQFFVHERRMIVGTVINRWIFEYLWSLKLTEPAGLLIARLNRDQPSWVEELIAQQVRARRWAVPLEVITHRLRQGDTLKVGIRSFVRLPIRLVATALTIPPAIMADRALRRRGSASLW